jgi:hypothetical protein
VVHEDGLDDELLPVMTGKFSLASRVSVESLDSWLLLE